MHVISTASAFCTICRVTTGVELPRLSTGYGLSVLAMTRQACLPRHWYCALGLIFSLPSPPFDLKKKRGSAPLQHVCCSYSPIGKPGTSSAVDRSRLTLHLACPMCMDLKLWPKCPSQHPGYSALGLTTKRPGCLPGLGQAFLPCGSCCSFRLCLKCHSPLHQPVQTPPRLVAELISTVQPKKSSVHVHRVESE